MRKPHVLRAKKGQGTWSQLAFLVTEFVEISLDNDHIERVPRSWTVRYERPQENYLRKEQYNTPDEALASLADHCNSKQRLVVFCKDVYADVIVGLQLPKAAREKAVTVGRFWIAETNDKGFIHVKKGGCSLLFVGICNLFEDGIVKEFPGLSEQENYWEVDRMAAMVTNYLRTIRKESLGEPAKTLAAQAFDLYRSKFMSHRIYCHDNETANALERDAYKGGRTECFVTGTQQGEWYKLDVNSMYPSVMFTGLFPTRLKASYRRSLPIAEVWERMENSFIIAEVEIETDSEQYPYRGKGWYGYPVGKFVTTLTSPLLAQAIHQGHVVNILRAAVYDQGPIFKEYVDKLWGKRHKAQQENDPAMARVYKLLLNSLYGKFGQRERLTLRESSWSYDDFFSGHHLENGQVYSQWFAFGKRRIFTVTDAPSHDAFPGIAATVCDLARMELWRLLVKAGEQNVAYVDTDCLIVNQFGRELLDDEIGSELGQLKEEGVADSITIYAPKDYEFGDVKKKKGIPADATYDPETGKWVFSQREGLRGRMERARREGRSEEEEIHIIRIKKKLRRDILGRTVLPDGRTVPLRLGD